MKIRCIVEFPTLLGRRKIADYIFDIDDRKQRRVFAEQMYAAYKAGQVVTTFVPQDEFVRMTCSNTLTLAGD